MADKNKNGAKQVGNPKIVTAHTSREKLLDIILSNKREFLLSETAEDTFMMMQITRELFVEYGSRTKVVEKMKERFPALQESTLWRYVFVTPQIFATIPQEATRNFWVDIHLEKIERTYRQAEELGDAKAMAMADRNRANAIEKFCGTKEGIDPSMLNLPDVIAAFHPEWFKDVPAIDSAEYEMLITQFKTSNDRRKKMQVVDIDYEEMFDDERNP